MQNILPKVTDKNIWRAILGVRLLNKNLSEPDIFVRIFCIGAKAKDLASPLQLVSRMVEGVQTLTTNGKRQTQSDGGQKAAKDGGQAAVSRSVNVYESEYDEDKDSDLNADALLGKRKAVQVGEGGSKPKRKRIDDKDEDDVPLSHKHVPELRLPVTAAAEVIVVSPMAASPAAVIPPSAASQSAAIPPTEALPDNDADIERQLLAEQARHAALEQEERRLQVERRTHRQHQLRLLMARNEKRQLVVNPLKSDVATAAAASAAATASSNTFSRHFPQNPLVCKTLFPRKVSVLKLAPSFEKRALHGRECPLNLEVTPV